MRERDIRPEHLHRRYLELSAEDAERCFSGVTRKEIACVACGKTDAGSAFNKNGFTYAQCRACGTLYLSPRPPIQAFDAFYRDSVSSRFWAEEFFPAVAEARRDLIFRPRVERLSKLCADKRIKVGRLTDIGAGYGIFLEEWRERFPQTYFVAIEPSPKLAQVCRDKGFEVVEDIAENVQGQDGRADLVVCFEVLEHVYDPISFIRTLSRLVRPGGYLFVSTLCVDGFDIQVLWEKSNSVFPPHHINFLSVAGFVAAFQRAGLVDVEVSTPGKLDVDIVRNAYNSDHSILEENRFVRLIIDDASRSASFQTFLSENRLSSHVWVIAQRPTGVHLPNGQT